jgi:hypothetical protein
MSDPKYTPKADGLYHEDGYKLPDDEPLMILRGKDVGALDSIVAYIEMLEDQPRNKTIHSHMLSSLERLQSFYYYQVNNPDLNSVGCSRRSHAAAAGFILRAKRKLLDYEMLNEV